jgi:hypothetical protein
MDPGGATTERQPAAWETCASGAYVTRSVGGPLGAVVTMWANEKPTIVRVRAEWGEPREHLETERVGHGEAVLVAERWAAELAVGRSPSR